MQGAAQAYGAVARQIANPRELEADLLLKAASQMQAVYDGRDRKRSDLYLALRYNRKLWSIFLTSVSSPEHALPVPVRQNVANLGLFVMNQTITMMSNPKRESLGALININRELATGLLGRALTSNKDRNSRASVVQRPASDVVDQSLSRTAARWSAASLQAHLQRQYLCRDFLVRHALDCSSMPASVLLVCGGARCSGERACAPASSAWMSSTFWVPAGTVRLMPMRGGARCAAAASGSVGRTGDRGKRRDVLHDQADAFFVGAHAVGDRDRGIDPRRRGRARRIAAVLAGVPGHGIGRRAGNQCCRRVERRAGDALRRAVEEVVGGGDRRGCRQRRAGELADRVGQRRLQIGGGRGRVDADGELVRAGRSRRGGGQRHGFAVPSGKLKRNWTVWPAFGSPVRSTDIAGGAPAGPVTEELAKLELMLASLNPNREPATSSAMLNRGRGRRRNHDAAEAAGAESACRRSSTICLKPARAPSPSMISSS